MNQGLGNMCALRMATEAGALASAPPPFMSAAPMDDGNIFLWRAVLVGTPGSAIGIVRYTVKPPNAGFLTPVPFSTRASWTNDKGQQVLCLSLLGDAAAYHREWAGAVASLLSTSMWTGRATSSLRTATITASKSSTTRGGWCWSLGRRAAVRGS